MYFVKKAGICQRFSIVFYFSLFYKTKSPFSVFHLFNCRNHYLFIFVSPIHSSSAFIVFFFFYHFYHFDEFFFCQFRFNKRPKWVIRRRHMNHYSIYVYRQLWDQFGISIVNSLISYSVMIRKSILLLIIYRMFVLE